MNRTPVLVLIALLALSLPGVDAKSSHVNSVVYDVFRDVDLSLLQTPPCPGGAIELLEDGFRFHEVPEDSPQQASIPALLGAPDGYLSTGCAIVVLPLTAPAAYDHVHVRFTADRGVDEFAIGQAGINPAGISFEQYASIVPDDAALEPFHLELFPANESDVPPQPFDVRSPVNPGPSFKAVWNFTDNGVSQDVFASGEDYVSEVRGLQVEFSGIPAEYGVHSKPERQGKVYLTQTDIVVPVPAVTDSDLRLDVSPNLRFAYVEAPDGTRITQSTTRTGSGPNDWNRGYVLAESNSQNRTWYTVPREFLGEHGPGDYKVSFTSVDTQGATPLLIPVLVLILLLPVPFAALAYLKVRGFEREAFGAYKRSARNLRVALVVATLYYLSVVLSTIVGSGLDVLVIWPLPVEALVTYGQVLIAVAAFIALYTVANELHSITRPREPVQP